MDRYAVFVDAGYLLGAGGWATVGTPRRVELDVEYEPLITRLCDEAAVSCPGRELLRIYWFDAAPQRQASVEQLRISEMADVKVRLGQLTARGDQKGVDSLILSDLTTLARERSIDTAVLVAGDGDLIEAVAQAQRHGVRVLLWGVETPKNTVSPDLRREADRFRWLAASELAPFFSRRETADVPAAAANAGSFASSAASIGAPAAPGAPAIGPAQPAGTVPRPRPLRPPVADTSSPLPVYVSIEPEQALAMGSHFARQWAAFASEGERAFVIECYPRIPGEIDARLIGFALDETGLASGTRFAPEVTRTLRSGFWAELDPALAPTAE